jgi:hypothetical protein
LHEVNIKIQLTERMDKSEITYSLASAATIALDERVWILRVIFALCHRAEDLRNEPTLPGSLRNTRDENNQPMLWTAPRRVESLSLV